MTEMTSYEPGVPCWVDLSTTDLPGAVSFYSRLFGWDAEDMGEQAGHYSMLRLRDLDAAAAAPQMPGQEGRPPAWNVYVAVSDADATATAIESAGGRVLMPPMDVFTSGRMAVAMDPQGAAFSIWQAMDHIGSRIVNEPGSLTWVELATRDVEAAFAFYSAVFGWGRNDTETAGMRYTELQVGGRSVAGMLGMTDQWPADVPPHWMPYFAVADTDATAGLAQELGGKVTVPPTDIPPGRFALLNDPQGGFFSVIRLAVEPSR
jgi:predicted enzyme related to lactoylglutathione lyase